MIHSVKGTGFGDSFWHTVTDAWFGEDIGGAGCAVAQFIAESLDCSTQRAQVEGTWLAPDMLHELVIGQGSAGAG